MSNTATIIVGKTYSGIRTPVAVDGDGKLQVAPGYSALINSLVSGIGTHTIVNMVYTGVQLTSATYYNGSTLVATLTFSYDAAGNMTSVTKS